MLPYFFGTGHGHLSDAIKKKAKRLGADLVNYTDTECRCGCGCKPHRCELSRRHWFEIPNRGEPFNSQRAREILDKLGLNESSRILNTISEILLSDVSADEKLELIKARIRIA